MANEKLHHFSSDIAMDHSSLGLLTTYCGVGKSEAGHITSGGIRFTNIDINKNATINFARLILPYDVASGSGSWKFIVYGIDEDNTGSFGNPFSRSQTSATVTINEGEPTDGGTKEINVASIVAEITSRSGWSNGNAIGFTFMENGSDTGVFAQFDGATSYFIYRNEAEPNFTPTPISVNVPDLPDAEDVGMKFSYPGISVFDATDEELLITTRKKTIKILAEDMHTSTEAGVTTIEHNLGYIPITMVWGKGANVGDDWVKLPTGGYVTNYLFAYADDTYLYLSATEAGEKFYYRILLDRIVI